MSEIEIITKDSIRALHRVEEGGKTFDLGELRDLRWSDALARFLGSSPLSIAWVRLSSGEVLHEHRHPVQSLMVFYRGSGEMRGDVKRSVRTGDVVVVPPGCEHGFVGGPEGLFGLSIQFADGLYTNPEAPRVHFSNEDLVAEILAFNEERARAIEETLRGDEIEDHLRVWLDAEDSLLAAWLATCEDPPYLELIAKCRRDRPRALASPRPEKRDLVLEATADWFKYQMTILDNSDRVALFLVARRASRLLRSSDAREAPALDLESEDITRLLRGAGKDAATSMRAVMAAGWDMIGAMAEHWRCFGA